MDAEAVTGAPGHQLSLGDPVTDSRRPDFGIGEIVAISRTDDNLYIAVHWAQPNASTITTEPDRLRKAPR